MKINKYFPFAFIYFFINSYGLPFGLTYTTILSPLFFFWVVSERKKFILLPFFLILLPWILVHLYNGVVLKQYLISILNFTAVYIFGQAFYTFLMKCSNVEVIFKRILVITFILCLIAIPVFFTPYRDILWIKQFLTEGVNDFFRLKLFTYEASYLATLFTPIFIFYFLQLLLAQNKISILILLPMLFLPYILSFSLGVISGILISIFLVFIIFFNQLIVKRRIRYIFCFSILSIPFILLLLLIFFPDNPLFVRLENLFSGNDLSGRGRTTDSFMLATKMLREKSYLWGIGAGQIKIIGAEIIRDYYFYPMEYTDFAIPNATAETLAVFGWFGMITRLAIEIFLFFYTRVWMNYYRICLFFFVFIYQFTGSFITNSAEYVIWILAFTNAFPQFNIRLKNHKENSVLYREIVND